MYDRVVSNTMYQSMVGRAAYRAQTNTTELYGLRRTIAPYSLLIVSLLLLRKWSLASLFTVHYQ